MPKKYSRQHRKELVSRLWELLDEGKKPKEVTTLLNEEGFKKPSGRRLNTRFVTSQINYLKHLGRKEVKAPTVIRSTKDIADSCWKTLMLEDPRLSLRTKLAILDTVLRAAIS